MSEKEKIAICPGSFDPVTLGHLDIIIRSAKIFDKVIVVVANNYSKDDYVFSPEERVELLKKCTVGIKNVEVELSGGLTADFAKNRGAGFIVKGLRAVSDFEFEFQQALVNKRLNSDIETVFITTSSENMFLSSSVVKQVCRYGGDISSFVPEEICREIVKRLKQ